MKRILPLIVVSQFLCTSVWFAGNAILPELVEELSLDLGFLGHLTSAVQFGFISGTLVFAILTLADRFSPRSVFLISSLIAAAFNLAIVLPELSSIQILLFRFGTGFFLAGIYPVGMKIASDYFEKGLGKSLGFLVGALVLGTAFPHLLRNLTDTLPWKSVLYCTSLLALLGGGLMHVFVPDGPFRKRSQSLDLTAFFRVFKVRPFRAAAFGYFGHMWELYAFWAFIPLMLTYFNGSRSQQLDIPFWSFIIIGIGAVSCAWGGVLSQRVLPKKIAVIALAVSGCCCLLSPLFFTQHSSFLLILYLCIWGLAVTADSPMFSTLVAQNVPSALRGTSLTIVNCIGFGITILSIQLLNLMMTLIPLPFLFPVLAAGPIFGLFSIWKIRERT